MRGAVMRGAVCAMLLAACGAAPLGRDVTVALDIPGGCVAAQVQRIDVRAYDLRDGYPIGGQLVARAPCGESMRAWMAMGDEPRTLAFWGMDEADRPTHVGIVKSEDLRGRVTLRRVKE
jgi:hypothetical protein